MERPSLRDSKTPARGARFNVREKRRKLPCDIHESCVCKHNTVCFAALTAPSHQASRRAAHLPARACWGPHIWLGIAPQLVHNRSLLARAPANTLILSRLCATRGWCRLARGACTCVSDIAPERLEVTPSCLRGGGPRCRAYFAIA
jgi:hypothetical protein